MADSPTTRNRLRKQEVGAKTNAWGTDWNEDGGSDRLDEALDGIVSFTLSGTTKTLTSTNYETDEARMRSINITGGTGGTVVIPAVEKFYNVRNGATGDVTIYNGSNSVAVVSGEVVTLFTDGTSLYKLNAKAYVDAAILNASLSSSLPSQTGNAGKYVTTDGTTASWSSVDLDTLTGILPTTNGGTGTADTAYCDLTANVDGTLPVTNGGTGATTSTGTGSVVLSSAPTITDPAITGCILEDIYTITDGAAFEIDPGNGSIQFITLGASRTPKATNFANGESTTLYIKDGTAYTITWTDATFGGSGVVWQGGSAPVFHTTNWNVVVLTKAGGQVYGFNVGSVA